MRRRWWCDWCCQFNQWFTCLHWIHQTSGEDGTFAESRCTRRLDARLSICMCSNGRYRVNGWPTTEYPSLLEVTCFAYRWTATASKTGNNGDEQKKEDNGEKETAHNGETLVERCVVSGVPGVTRSRAKATSMTETGNTHLWGTFSE